MTLAFALFALWLALIYLASSQALRRGRRKELWRSIMGALVGLSVATRDRRP